MKFILPILLFVQIACKTTGNDCDPIPEHIFPLVKNSDKVPSTLIVSHFTIDNNFIMRAVDNHKEYAKKHHYDYWFRNGIIDGKSFENPGHEKCIFKIGLYWQKIKAIEDAFAIQENGQNKYEWVMWVDGDAVFTDMDKSVDDLLKEVGGENSYFIITKDISSCVNAGVFLIRNNTQGRELIANVRKSFDNYKSEGFPEQIAIEDFIYGLAKFKDNELQVAKFDKTKKCGFSPVSGVKIIDQSYMNAFYSVNFKPNTRWKAGMYIAHFAGDPVREINLPQLLDCMELNKKNLSDCEYLGKYHQNIHQKSK